MKKIEFGTDNGLRPNGSWDSIGLSNGVLSGELIGLFNYDGDDYIVTKVGDTFQKSQYDENKIMVSRAIADLYKDGSGNIFIDQERSLRCENFEELLNSDKARSLIERGVSVADICNGHLVSKAFDVLIDRNSINALGINHDVFENKKRALLYCNKSFSDMMAEMEALVAKLNELQADKEQNRSL